MESMRKEDLFFEKQKLTKEIKKLDDEDLILQEEYNKVVEKIIKVIKENGLDNEEEDAQADPN